MINSVVLVSGVQQSGSVIHVHMSILFQILFPFRWSHNIEQSSLCYTVGPCWLSIFVLFLFIYLFAYLFIYFWLCWVFTAAHGVSLVVVSGSYSLLWCVGFSLRWLLLLQSTDSRHADFSSCSTRASVVAAHGLSSCSLRALECRLRSCGVSAQ